MSSPRRDEPAASGPPLVTAVSVPGVPDLTAAAPRQLATLFKQAPLFSNEDLQAMLAHQLAAPLQFHQTELDQKLFAELARLRAAGTAPETFGQLLTAPKPPVPLLVLLKDFAKAIISGHNDTLPDKLASVLYFTAISVAFARCDQQISQLNPPALRHGITWCLDQPWVADPCRQLFAEALARLPK